jgi:hypothetical protein
VITTRANLGQQQPASSLRDAYLSALVRCFDCERRRPVIHGFCRGCWTRFWHQCLAEDECLGCFELSPPGSQWAWGCEDRGLCGECAMEWRKAGGEMGPLVWGRAS